MPHHSVMSMDAALLRAEIRLAGKCGGQFLSRHADQLNPERRVIRAARYNFIRCRGCLCCNVFFLRKQPHASRRTGGIFAKKGIAPVWPLPLGMPNLQESEASSPARQASKKKSSNAIAWRARLVQRSEISQPWCWIHRRRKFLAIKSTLAGRSANLRMK
jgi:hypothetical protein